MYFGKLPIYTSNTDDNILHKITLTKLNVGSFMGTGGFLITNSDGHM